MRTLQTSWLGEENGRRARFFLALIATAGIVAAAASCSLIVDTSADECADDAGCKVPGQTCSKIADKPSICVAVSTTCDDAKCQAQGEGFVCRNAKCVGLLSKECRTFHGDYKDANAVFLGSILPTTGGDGSTGRPIENSLKLALDDFNLTASGLPPVAGSTKRRPMVLVGCSDDSDNPTAIIAAKHLAEEVGVAAIIGGAFSGITIDIANTVTIPNNVLLISPSATSVAITDLDDHDLVWRTSPPDSFQAQALALYMPEVEAKVRVDLGLLMNDKVKVAILNKGDAYGSGLAKALGKKLTINGMPATDQSNNGSYLRFDYGNPDDPTANPTKYPQAIAQVLAFKPHVMLVFGANEGVTDIFAKVEEQWNGAPMVAYRPQVIFSDAGEIPELWQYVAKNDVADTLRPRIRGTVPGTDNALFKAYHSAYTSKFQDGTSPDVFGAAGGYDIIYLLGYSASGLGATPVTGVSLSQRMKKMNTGAKVEVGTDAINSTFLKVASDGAIDFNGASGPLDFDTTTGEAPSDIQIWCIPNDQGTGKAGSALNSGKSYSAPDDKLIGSIGAYCN